LPNQSLPNPSQHPRRSIPTQIMVNEAPSSSSHISGDTETKIPILPDGDG
jgi:hypothetical protein